MKSTAVCITALLVALCASDARAQNDECPGGFVNELGQCVMDQCPPGADCAETGPFGEVCPPGAVLVNGACTMEDTYELAEHTQLTSDPVTSSASWCGTTQGTGDGNTPDPVWYQGGEDTMGTETDSAMGTETDIAMGTGTDDTMGLWGTVDDMNHGDGIHPDW